MPPNGAGIDQRPSKCKEKLAGTCFDHNKGEDEEPIFEMEVDHDMAHDHDNVNDILEKSPDRKEQDTEPSSSQSKKHLPQNCTKYHIFTDEQRIDLLYDHFHHGLRYYELAENHHLNYMGCRNIIELYKQQTGTTYNHQMKYTDINNPILTLALKEKEGVSEDDQTVIDEWISAAQSKVCGLYLFTDWADSDDLKVFSASR